MNTQSMFLTLCGAFVVFLFLHGCSTDTQAEQADKQLLKASQTRKVLIFTKTTGWRHKSIEQSTEYLSDSLTRKGIEAVITEDASVFIDSNLSTFSALIFLNTTGNVLNGPQQVAMERYIQAGGGFVGIHAASDTEWEGDWFWYRRLVGGIFASHPNVPSNVQTARIQVLRKDHPATENLPDNFQITDEWYDFRSLSDRRVDLLVVDEKSYQGGAHGAYHPIAWYHAFDGGRSFYTGIGHREENFTDPLYLQHVLGGVEYAIGNNVRDYSKSRPQPNRFVKEKLLDKLNEPVSLDITKDGSGIIFIERKGQVNWFDVTTNKNTKIGKIDVFSAVGFGEFGLLTVALDPNFDTNKHMYMMYNVPSPINGAGPLQRVSRFTMVNGKIDLSTRINMLEGPNDDTCCHTGGNMEFDGAGNLFIALGDNTNPFNSFGKGPADFRDGQEINDAYRSSANTQDFRGKILRITPQADGSYTIPEGNLFADPKIGKPEIYVMGTRNPYTLAYDDKEQTLYIGDVGPDSNEDEDDKGSKGYDEINKVTQAGNFGWPLFIGNNRAYRKFDYSTEVAGDWNNPLTPHNTSPRNTGAEWLPPAQGAYIWYPYSESDIFPELKTGGRNALVAGVYRTKTSAEALPAYYEGGLFISDFMRRWIKVVFSDKNGDIYKIEEFAPEAEFIAPIDLKFSHQGQLYILEYGSKWHNGNDDASLSRVVYTGPGNRTPIARIDARPVQGIAPLTVNLSATNSMDPDHDEMQFDWQVVLLKPGQSLDDTNYMQALKSNDETTEFTLTDKGRYALSLTVTDSSGEAHTVSQLIEVGNAAPVVKISVEGNQSFIWPTQNANQYNVSIQDLEDGKITQDSPLFERVDIAFEKQNTGVVAQAVGHLANDPFGPGRAAAKKNLCMGCHQEQEQSVGPAFKLIADKYKTLANPVDYLTKSIATGSTGKWGQHQMPAHDFLSDNVRRELSSFIMLLKSKAPSLPLSGKLPEVSSDGSYILQAVYTDQGAPGLSTIMSKSTVTLRTPTIQAETLINNSGDASGIRLSDEEIKTIVMSGDRAVLSIGTFDLTRISGLKIAQTYLDRLPKDVLFSLHAQSETGEVISEGKFTYTNLKDSENATMTLSFNKALTRKLSLFLVVTLPDIEASTITANVRSVSFIRE